MLAEIIEMLKKSKFNENEINHALSIILRTFDEINYMCRKNRNISFELKQMERFSVYFKENYIDIFIEKEKIQINKAELSELIDNIYDFFQNKYPIDYDYKLIDPIYFSLFFYDLLGKIIKVKYDVVNISKLRLLRRNSEPVAITETESYKALLDKSKKNIYTPFKSNHIIDTDRARLNTTLKSIRKHGYPYGNKLAILYNDEVFIRDGQHRIAVLKYLYGDINIKVLRIYLVNNKFYS